MNTVEKNTYKVSWTPGLSSERKALQERMFHLVEAITDNMAKDKSLTSALKLNDGDLAKLIFEKQLERDAHVPERELRVIQRINEGTRKFVNRLSELGGTLKAGEVAKLINKSRQAVHHQQKTGKLLAVRPGNDYLFPVFQFQGEKVVNGFEEVMSLLDNEMSPVTKVSFFTAMHYFEDTELNVIDAMKLPDAERYIDEIKRQAALFGRHIAK